MYDYVLWVAIIFAWGFVVLLCSHCLSHWDKLEQREIRNAKQVLYYATYPDGCFECFLEQGEEHRCGKIRKSDSGTV